MERVLEERSRQLILPADEDSATNAGTADCHASNCPDPNLVQSAAEPSPTNSELRRQRRLERYGQVVALFKAGESQVAISRALGIERKTVRRWLRRGEFPERKPPHRRPAKVNAFAAYLEQRWSEGCHNATTLYHEIREKVIKANAQWLRVSLLAGDRPGNRQSPKLQRRFRRSMLPSL